MVYSMKLQMHNYKMGNDWLDCNTTEEDLRIIVDHKMNVSQQCNIVAETLLDFWDVLIEESHTDHRKYIFYYIWPW